MLSKDLGGLALSKDNSSEEVMVGFFEYGRTHSKPFFNKGLRDISQRGEYTKYLSAFGNESNFDFVLLKILELLELHFQGM